MGEAGADRGNITVFLLDDHEIVRRGVHDLLEAEPDITVIGEAGTAGTAPARVPPPHPDAGGRGGGSLGLSGGARTTGKSGDRFFGAEKPVKNSVPALSPRRGRGRGPRPPPYAARVFDEQGDPGPPPHHR